MSLHSMEVVNRWFLLIEQNFLSLKFKMISLVYGWTAHVITKKVFKFLLQYWNSIYLSLKFFVLSKGSQRLLNSPLNSFTCIFQTAYQHAKPSRISTCKIDLSGKKWLYLLELLMIINMPWLNNSDCCVFFFSH